MCVRNSKGAPFDIVANVQGCLSVVSDFEIQSCYYVHFQTNNLEKDLNTLILQVIG